VDNAIRVKERRFRETGEVADEVAWLRERLRAGEVSRKRVELARHCGHEASALLLGRGCDTDAMCLKCWQEPAALDRLVRLGGHEARCRAAIVAANLILERHRAEEDLFAAALATAFVNPDWPDQMHEAIAAAERKVLGDPLPREQLLALRRALGRPTASNMQEITVPLDAALGRAHIAWSSIFSSIPKNQLFPAIGREIATWALGYGDPVREQIAQREKSRGV
jgi:hypothetical protein